MMTIVSVYFSSSRSPAKTSTRSFSCLYVQSNLFKITTLMFLTCILTIAAQDTSGATAIFASVADVATGISMSDSVGGTGVGSGTGSTHNIVSDGVDQERAVAAEGAGATATHTRPVRT
jgi:hypothetical protein